MMLAATKMGYMHWCDMVVIGPGLGQSEKVHGKQNFILPMRREWGNL